MREIVLTKGYVATVDDSDYEWLMQWKWCALVGRSTIYAVRRDYERQRLIYMHRQILGLDSFSDKGDHRDGNGLNNQRGNLRQATCFQNNGNQKIAVHNTSGFKGVSYHIRLLKWRAQIRLHRKSVHLGYFNSRPEAAMAYDDAARQAFGEFAKTNF